MELQSPTVGKLALALSKVQADLEPAKKKSQNPYFKSHYADLAECLDACLKTLALGGLALSQTTVRDEYGVALVTTLMHESGEWIRGFYPITGKDNMPQTLGAAVTYAKRYALCAIIGLATEDDDGESAEDREPKKTQHDPVRTQITAKESDVRTEKELKDLDTLRRKMGWSDAKMKENIELCGVQKAKYLNPYQFKKLMDNVQAFPEKGFPK